VIKVLNSIVVVFGVAGSLWCGFASNRAQAQGDVRTIFQIGKRDQSFTEFARKRNPGAPVVYDVGRSTPGADWFAYQPGLFDYQVAPSTREASWVENKSPSSGNLAKDPVPVPYKVKFSLGSPPQGKFVLHLDAIFRYGRPAAPRYEIDINGHAGSYQLAPKPAPDLWWPTGSGAPQFIGYQSLDMPLPASYFHAGGNTLTLKCAGGFGIYYDDLSLFNDRESSVAAFVSANLQPTIFYKRRGGELVELATLKLQTSEPLGRATLRAEIGSKAISANVEQSSFGDVETTIEVPATEQPARAAVYLEGQQSPVYQGSFVPARRWRVYAMPAEQADFGYDEVPARTLEWENRYTDRVLEIMKRYPSYSFNLDAAENLESYLATRDDEHREQLLGYLRNGKIGLNAMYAGFFTGAATTEELFQTIGYALAAGAHYKFPVDSASQTDEPTVTWALPQVLAAAGVKYFAEGSDPIRGPFNPIGHMNFHSPFYWEAPNGSKLLVWSAVSYVNIEDMAWGGWNLGSVEKGKYSPSSFGLEHSLPLFLSQYERKDYPFDAVLLYGLHNDEIPIWHNASADVIANWNQEYAYPAVIPSTQRDFYTYVVKNFDSSIKTLRGDAGAYWEDEMGADAKVAALNRTSQMQVVAAEKLDSIAQWLKPDLRVEGGPYRDAWKNILLADDYVWSDQYSTSRPFSYRTQYEEDAHRGYADAAYRQTRDLLRIGMDRVAELVKTDKPGVAVFNTETWQRGGFFDVELKSTEALKDPADGHLLSCGNLKVQTLYNEVKCWAPAIPPLGYKVYTIVDHPPATIQAGKIESAATAIEGKYYRLQLNSQTGAVAHLIDKATGKDLVNGPSGYGLNEYVYISGGDPVGRGSEKGSGEDNRILSSDPTLPLPHLTIHRPRTVGPAEVKRFPWGVSVTIHARSINTPQLTSTIILNDEEKSVIFDNELQKQPTLKREGIYFAFPFGVEKPKIEYQGATAWVNPETDMLPGANCEWFATQAGVRISGGKQNIGWASVDAPLITLGHPNRGLWPTTIQIKDGTVFSYVMNNYWYTDTPAQQDGHFRFRYILTSGDNLSQANTAQLAIGARSPLYVIPLEHKEWTPILPEQGQSFVSTSPRGISVVAMRPVPGERGAYLLRVQNGTSQATDAQIRFPGSQLEGAYIGSVMGDKSGSVDWSAHQVNISMAPSDVKTVVIRVGSTSATSKGQK
jgi:alpha-mannosidase